MLVFSGKIQVKHRMTQRRHDDARECIDATCIRKNIDDEADEEGNSENPFFRKSQGQSKNNINEGQWHSNTKKTYPVQDQYLYHYEDQGDD